MMKSNQAVRLAAALAAMAVVTGCTMATPYRPLSAQAGSAGGYSDQRIEENRFNVMFSGNSMTSRETVETFLLYRAAELTRTQGYDWFVIADRDTERKTRTSVSQPFSSGAYGYWGPSWRYQGRGFGWRTWDPYAGGAFWDRDIDVRTVDRYEANAEIVMGRGAKPEGDPRAFDARQVLSNLGDRVTMPS